MSRWTWTFTLGIGHVLLPYLLNSRYIHPGLSFPPGPSLDLPGPFLQLHLLSPFSNVPPVAFLRPLFSLPPELQISPVSLSLSNSKTSYRSIPPSRFLPLTSSPTLQSYSSLLLASFCPLFNPSYPPLFLISGPFLHPGPSQLPPTPYLPADLRSLLSASCL